MGWRVMGSNPGKEKIFSSSPKHPDQVRSPTRPFSINQYQCTFHGFKASEV